MATLRDKVVSKARSQLGVRYWSMHTGPKGSKSEGWGCAMFCAWCLNQVLGTDYVGGTFNFWGEVIGAPTYNQGRTYAFEEIKASEAQPGDLVCYFYPNASIGYSSSCGHIAMYVGNGRVIGAMGRGTPGSSDYLNIGIKETAVGGQDIGGFIRYIRCKRLKGVKATTATSTSASTSSSKTSGSSKTTTTKGDFALSKKVTFAARRNVRDAPNLTSSKVVTYYSAGQSVTLDSLTISAGLVWGHYIGSSSGKDRWVAIANCNGYLK